MKRSIAVTGSDMFSKFKHSVVVTAAFAVMPAVAFAQSTAEFGKEVNAYGDRITKLEQRYLKPAMLASKYKLEARYNDARVAYFMQDYGQASILLVDVVRNEKFKGFESYREALFLLGDSLFQMRNYVAARRYFEQVFTLGPGPYYEESAGRMLEIAYMTRNFDRLDELYSKLQGSTMSAALSYLSGKAFYEQKNYSRARENFARAAASPEYQMVAEYFRGTAYAAEGKIADARKVFEALAKTAQPATERQYEVLDLTWLALGRLAYEEGDIEYAIDFYNRVGKESKHYDRMLWELTWVLVSRGNFLEARRNVDIIQFLEDPDPDIAAEAQLLRADLSLKLDEYDAARADYEAVLDKFTPVAAQMREFVTKHQDLPTFFAAMVQERLAGVESDLIPPLVNSWILDDPDMRAASTLLADVRRVDREISDSHRMLDEIGARLNSSTRIQSFPELAEGMALAVDAEGRLVEIRQKLLLAQYEAVKGSMGPADKARWEQVLQNIAGVQQRFETMPANRKAQVEREAMVADEFDRMRRRLDQAGFELDAQQAQLNAVNTYIENNYGRPMSDAEKKKVVAMRDQLKEQLAIVEQAKRDLEHELNLNRQQVGVGDAVMLAERRLRRDYRDQLEQARTFLASFSGNSAELQRIEAVRSQIPGHEQRLDSFFGRMDKLVEERIAELRKDIDVERELMNDHRQSTRELVTASQNGAGVLAYLNFMRAQNDFNEIILRGDVGVIDVVWEKKEDMSTKISDLFEERTSELRLLQESFEEVR